jgi:phospholipase/carboxylesterase
MRDRGLGAALAARPGVPGQRRAAGVERLQGGERDGVLFLPERAPGGVHPLIVLLHGAGGDWANIFSLLEARAEEAGCALLVPDSRDYTWDVIVSEFGPDVRFLDRALAHTFSRCHVDPAKIAVAGFSDGGSYALSLGLANGDLFRHVMAFSPGFQAAPVRDGLPRVFVSHGVEDRVLPIDRCSRRIVPQMERAGYPVTYREFAGGHTVPEPIVNEAMQWFLE